MRFWVYDEDQILMRRFWQRDEAERFLQPGWSLVVRPRTKRIVPTVETHGEALW